MRNFTLVSLLLFQGLITYSQTFTDIFHPYDLDYIHEIEHGDFNGDGKPDFVIVSSQIGNFWIGINNSLSTAPDFKLISSDYNLSHVETLDFDLDGDIDIISSEPFEDITIVWINDGNANFTELRMPTWPYDAMAFADLNADGVMEAIIAYEDQLGIFNITASGLELQITIAEDDPFRGRAGDIITLDYDADGDLDIAAVFDVDGVVLFEQILSDDYLERQLFKNTLNNTEIYHTELNDDGIVDFVIQSDFGKATNLILSNGTEYEKEKVPNPIGENEFTLLADFDRDGTDEIIYTEADTPFDAEISIVRYNAGIEKQLILDDHEGVEDGGVVDLDNDGDLDFYLFTNDRFDAGLVYFLTAGGIAQVDGDGDGSFEGDDCDDNDPTVYPGATEICDQKDNDCNGAVDDGLTEITVYADSDDDGYGDPNTETTDCELRIGFVDVAGDCNDNDAAIFPGALEICDGIDNDCNGDTDDGLTEITVYVDSDGDGFGDTNSQSTDCELRQGFVDVGGDCDDTEETIYPGATEILDNDIDEDCDGFDLSSIHELDDVTISIFPNPIVDRINIDISENINYAVSFYNQNGSLLIKRENAKSILVGDFPSGIYLLKFTDLNSGKSIIERIIKN